MIGHVPKMTDLIAEKMKTDESFFQFASRWRDLASRSPVVMPESEAVSILIHNYTPQFRAILPLSDLTTFAQLYHRAKIVQTQIPSRTRLKRFNNRRNQNNNTTTEGEQVNSVSWPVRPNNRNRNNNNNQNRQASNSLTIYVIGQLTNHN